MDLQIVRTLKVPATYVQQIASLNTESGWPTDAQEIDRRVKQLSRDDRLLLALDGEQLIGYAHVHISHDLLHDETAEVVNILVHPQFRRQGVGRRLIAAAETWAQQSGKARLLLRTNVLQRDTHAFFTSLGYDKESTSVDFIRDLGQFHRSEQPTQQPRG